MQEYQSRFFDFVLEVGALRFGKFTLKSGRISPWFFNTGLFSDGPSVARLGYYYATALHHSARQPDVIYGPAYKGIPLVTATAIALAQHYDADLPFAFNRKEIKDHGEGGEIVGAQLQGNVAIIDDVITAGTSVVESIEIIRRHKAIADSVFISINRQERLKESSLSASQWLEDQQGIPVISIASFDDLIQYLEKKPEFIDHLPAMQAYRQHYGV